MSKMIERGNKGLNQSFVDSAPIGRHLDNNGLYLVVKAKGQGSWIYRRQRGGKRVEVGLGGLAAFNLQQARDRASTVRLALRDGQTVDQVRAALGRGKVEETPAYWRLDAVAQRCFESKKSSLKGAGDAGRWFSPLELHVLPKLGYKDVAEITSEEVEKTLKPIWTTKHPTAKKAADRLGIIIRFASDEGASVDEAAVDRAKRVLGAVKSKPVHITSTPFKDIPDFYAKVCNLEISPATLALRLALLTCHRASPVRFARIEEFDLDEMIWIAPAKNMKGKEGETSEFRCPLSPEAVRVVELAIKHSRAGKLFPAQRGHGVVSDVGMAQVFKRVGITGTTHGLRSSFGEWAMSQEISLEMSDRCLQHSVGGKVSRAYHRGDVLERRRIILDSWANYTTSAREKTLRAGLRVVL